MKNNYKYGKLNSSEIVSDLSYQRPLDSRRVKKIVNEFNPSLVNPIKVSFRDGKYFVFDGQHTLKALVLNNNGKDLMVECKIYSGLTREEEAGLFAEQNGLSKAVAIADKMKAKHLSGNEQIKELKEGIESLGLVFDFSKNKANNKIICYNTVLNIYRKYSVYFLMEVLQIIIDAWDRSEDSLRKEIISGMTIFCKTYEGFYKRDELVKKLSKVSAAFILREGSVVRTGGDKRYAKQILNVYNKGRASNKLEDRI